MTQSVAELNNKHTTLRGMLAEMGRVVVAFSGGVDSTLVLKVAHNVLGRENVLAATAVSPSLAGAELESCERLAVSLGCDLQLVATAETNDPRYIANNPDRCYFCKTELYAKLIELARTRDMRTVINGVNADDAADHVHGIRAAHEFGIRMPLADAGLTKSDVRALSRQLGLPNWEKPALACLSSRVAYGVPVTIETLSKIESAETFLRERGFVNFRVRNHEKLARIEVDLKDVTRLSDEPLRSQLVEHLKGLGYAYVTVDLQGYRSGSGNEWVTAAAK